mmetsp:Transcript_538/g.772  ORF Transcript_538/g.772 Transcript_538/m.772 type:complete len:201 (-) Transcript_538:46-648(-)|eukprot:CAMPEP_0184540906 /NCGR_PEP_ID=MMETSP0199_2-20130426/1021_1 /TAXON_ID=1112570 /ORGANISM="Thraustochytrium sp., Strain LLF1b" /LENGTH=200 /DNA_ID=CAMNT_0026934581 /DNA_START=54 /DNA_END=656 /DNA_ORIENTATION=-
MTFEKLVVIDCRAHLIGRLASTIAKDLLLGQRIVAVRCEELEISGAIWRNEIKLAARRHKKTNSNPERGPFIQRSPAQILLRMVRGMIPHKTTRGKIALNRFKCFEGVPHPYDSMKRKVVPVALRALKLAPGRKFTNLGELTTKNGWKYRELVHTLEAKRKVKAQAYYEKKCELEALKKQAAEQADVPDDVKKTLEMYGY